MAQVDLLIITAVGLGYEISVNRAYTIRDVKRAVLFSLHGPYASASRSGELPNATDLHLFHVKRLCNDCSTLKGLGIGNFDNVLYLM